MGLIYTIPGQTGILRRVRAHSLLRLWLLALLAGCGGGVAGVQPLEPPEPLQLSEDLELEVLKGDPLRLAALRGRAVLVLYFATWCPPCMNQVNALVALSKSDKPIRGLAILGVVTDKRSKRGLRKVLHWVPFPIAKGKVGKKGPFGPVSAVPTAFLVDAEGRVVERFAGLTPINYVRQRVAEMTQGER